MSLSVIINCYFDSLGGSPDDAKEVMKHPFFHTVNWDDVFNKRVRNSFNFSLLSVRSSCKCNHVQAARAKLGFYSMKYLGVFLLSPGWGTSTSQGYAKYYLTNTDLYTWIEKKCEAKFVVQKKNLMIEARP